MGEVIPPEMRAEKLKERQQFVEFRKILDEMYELHLRKNHDYGGFSDGGDNIKALGEKGVYVRMFDKMSRLKTLVWNNEAAQVKDETADDTLYDLAVYSIIMLILRRGKWGI